MRTLTVFVFALVVGCASTRDAADPRGPSTSPPGSSALAELQAPSMPEPVAAAPVEPPDIEALMARFGCQADRDLQDDAQGYFGECDGDALFLVVIEACTQGSMFCSIDGIATVLQREEADATLQPKRIQLPTAGELRAYSLDVDDGEDNIHAFFADERLPGDIKIAACAWRNNAELESTCIDFLDRLIAPR